jgi:hypothetical protein
VDPLWLVCWQSSPVYPTDISIRERTLFIPSTCQFVHKREWYAIVLVVNFASLLKTTSANIVMEVALRGFSCIVLSLNFFRRPHCLTPQFPRMRNKNLESLTLAAKIFPFWGCPIQCSSSSMRLGIKKHIPIVPLMRLVLACQND